MRCWQWHAVSMGSRLGHRLGRPVCRRLWHITLVTSVVSAGDLSCCDPLVTVKKTQQSPLPYGFSELRTRHSWTKVCCLAIRAPRHVNNPQGAPFPRSKFWGAVALLFVSVKIEANTKYKGTFCIYFLRLYPCFKKDIALCCVLGLKEMSVNFTDIVLAEFFCPYSECQSCPKQHTENRKPHRFGMA